MFNSITSYQTFIEVLKNAGFTMAGDNGEGIFTVAKYYSKDIEAHTDQPNTDPWAWRMLSIGQYDDIFYSKIFLNKGGFITGEFYPYLYVIRRKHQSFEDMYEAGQLSYESKQIYEIVKKHPNIALHEIKSLMISDIGNKPKIEAAITSLQMKMFIIISGEKFKLSKEGKPFGWPVTTFALVEHVVKPSILEAAQSVTIDEAIKIMTSRIRTLNPEATDKDIKKFLG